ncbi:MAG: hypothetical protein AB1441_08775 [Bacillota bacterium]
MLVEHVTNRDHSFYLYSRSGARAELIVPFIDAHCNIIPGGVEPGGDGDLFLLNVQFATASRIAGLP